MIVHSAPQRTLAWHRARAGIPTASEAKQLITPKTLKLSASLVPYAWRLALAELRGHEDERFDASESWSTTRGRELEPRARAAYAMIRRCDVREVGLCTDERRRVGGSPDGLVGEDGGVELKCPEEAEFLRVLRLYETTGEVPPDYLPQVHMLLLVTGRPWWDLVFWHPYFPDEPVVVRVHRSAAWARRLLRGVARVRREKARALVVLRRRSRSLLDRAAEDALGHAA